MGQKSHKKKSKNQAKEKESSKNDGEREKYVLTLQLVPGKHHYQLLHAGPNNQGK